MIDPVTGQVRPNGMQEVRALPMTIAGGNPFMMAATGMPQQPQVMPAPMPPQNTGIVPPAMGGSPVPAMGGMDKQGGPQMPRERPDLMSRFGNMFSGGLPPGLQQALLQMQQRFPNMFGNVPGIMQRFGMQEGAPVAPQPQGFAPPAQGFGGAGNGFGFGANKPIGMDAGQLAATSGLGMQNQGQARNQNLGGNNQAY